MVMLILRVQTKISKGEGMKVEKIIVVKNKTQEHKML